MTSNEMSEVRALERNEVQTSGVVKRPLLSVFIGCLNIT